MKWFVERLTSYYYNDVIMSAMESQITSLTIVHPTVYSRRRSKNTSKLRVTGLCDWWPVNTPHKGPVTRKMFPFDDVIVRIHKAVGNRATYTDSYFITVTSIKLNRLVFQVIRPYTCSGSSSLLRHFIAWLTNMSHTRSPCRVISDVISFYCLDI